jgi:hypothetical protein
LVYDRKLVRRDHLEIISPSYRRLGENRSILLNRAIKKLFHQMVLDKVHEVQEIGKGNTPSIVAIDKGGSIILGVPHKKRITHKASTVKGITYITRNLPSNYRHINGVNQAEVDTILFCEHTNNDLLQWKLEVATTFHYNGEEKLFIPDAFMELRFGDKQFLAFLEYDTGSENLRKKNDFPIIYEKLQNYRRYKRSKLWIDKYAYFPVLLFVTEDENRIDYFNKKRREFGLEGVGIYYENYTDVLGHLARF